MIVQELCLTKSILLKKHKVDIHLYIERKQNAEEEGFQAFPPLILNLGITPNPFTFTTLIHLFFYATPVIHKHCKCSKSSGS